MTSIIVQIDSDTKSIECLNLENNLSNVRKQLEQNNKVELNETLFAKKIGQRYSLIAKEDEGLTKLKEIVETRILYLQSEFTREFFSYHLKLEYGCTVDLGRANKKAFTIVDCEMTKIEGCQNDTKEIDSMDCDRIAKENLLTNVQDFAKLGVPIESSRIKKSKFRTNTYYNISEYSKVSLKFKELKPTEEFIKAVKIAIESKDPRKFKDITKEFGQFIPKEVILGGRAYFEEPNAHIQTLIINAVNKNFKRNNSKCEGFKLAGGVKLAAMDSNEPTWIRTLEDFRNWNCIKFKDPISIFQLLPEDLRKQILALVGKKILYTNTENYFCKLYQPGTPQNFELKLPEYILVILRNEDTECNVFATVMDAKMKKDTFNCQILCPPNENPRLIVHCIQEKFKKCEYELKIRLMIIGYDINFNFNRPNFDVQLEVQRHVFKKTSNCQADSKLDLNYDSSVLCFGIPVLRKLDSSSNSLVIGHHFYKDEENESIGLHTFAYDLKKNHYVNLPDFTFYTLIISNNLNSGILPFKRHKCKLNFTKSNPLPKFISLYSTGKDNCGPIFLKQRINKVILREAKELKDFDTNCRKEKCICKNKKSEKNLKIAYFDPNQDKN